MWNFSNTYYLLYTNSGMGKTTSPSFFWSCVTLSDDCPFFSATDPRFFYFGVGLMTLYATFLLTILVDLNFYWTIDNFQQRIDSCINFVKKNLRKVEVDQQKLVSGKERTEKQIKKSKECTKIVTALRGALMLDDPSQMQALTESINENNLEIIRNID